MACFIVPGGEAVVVTLLSKAIENHYKKTGRYDPDSGYTSKFAKIVQKRKWLTGLLWGGCALLAFEHLWHGEIVPYFPFLTAAYTAEDTQVMLNEMVKVGSAMSVFITSIWVVMVMVSCAWESRVHSYQKTMEIEATK